MKKYVKWAGIVFGGLIILAVLAGLILHRIGMEKLTRTYPDIPVETIGIPTDSDAVMRGQQVSATWDCAECHGKDLSGKLFVDAPIIGTFSAPNLTSGEGGIGSSYTDIDWVRAIRHGVKPNGRVEIFMDGYSTMSDRDLGDLISYLKQIPSVDSDYPATNYGAIFPIAPALGLFIPSVE
jgi:mono/diheme cytochrome c family protein